MQALDEHPDDYGFDKPEKTKTPYEEKIEEDRGFAFLIIIILVVGFCFGVIFGQNHELFGKSEKISAAPIVVPKDTSCLCQCVTRKVGHFNPPKTKK